jgi:putative transposase
MKLQPIEAGKYYHIFNKGINGCNIFIEPENYQYFIRLYEKYIDPVTETFAFCLLRNHFHYLIRIKEPQELTDNTLNEFYRGSTENYNPPRQFSHLFNAYAQAFNKRYERKGSLFVRPFRRKLVENEKYFRQLIFYIHYNPVHHGFTDSMIDYPWSSYKAIISIQPTKLSRNRVIGYFDDVGNYIAFHKQKQDLKDIAEYILEE